MELYDKWKAVLRIQKLRRIVGYAGFYCFVSCLTYVYTNNTTRAGYSRADQFYASYPAGTELLTDTAKLYKAALGNCFEVEEWGPIEFCIMAKHFERQGKPPYAYHALKPPCILLRNYTRCTTNFMYYDFDDLIQKQFRKDVLKDRFPFSGISRIPSPVVLMELQYMAHLLSHGQLDGSG